MVNLFSIFNWWKGEKYGETIGSAMQRGKSLEDAIREAYNTHGAISPSAITTYYFSQSPFFLSLSGVVSGYYKQKIGFYGYNLFKSLKQVSKEMLSNRHSP
ncbi:hypothetical protein [Solidesulfovibrio fructosivorans]|uniref:hypothetical protein n=1 Tax=Solidesulfovibrio fructosivorans TaxID=878 RepID=UPI00117F7AEA|nr:hypothetical protein [Solidesulfovibrio fructosivorans]